MLLAAVLAVAATAGFARAQGGATSTISGSVVDTSGGIVPGADITAKQDATGTAFTAVSGSDGRFTIPAVPTGTYTIIVSLSGFKTVQLKDVVVTGAGPANVKATLEIGGLEETVVVGGATEVVQTQSSSVASTLSERQIASLPVAARAAFDLVAYIPGVSSSDGTTRGATVNGLPSSAVNITLDGMNIQDNYAKTWDGMFTRVSPRIDAV
ncbi:MAG TPA: carboxypeptidase-like regulatory domain-containing protein, partial [Vicinamibacterales bacterium]